MNKFLSKISILLLSSTMMTSVAYANNSDDGGSMSVEQMRSLQAQAVNKRDPISQFLFGKELLERKLVDKGLSLLYYSAVNPKINNGGGYEKAQRYLAEYFISTGQYKQASAWMRKSAATGNHKSAYMMSTMYRLGLGVEEDFSKSYAWMKLATKGGYSEAYRALGQMEMIGLGTAKNPESSIINFNKSINKKNYTSMLILGMYYKINRINDAVANELIENAASNSQNFIANYVYKHNVKGEVTEINILAANSGSVKNKKKGRKSKKSKSKTLSVVNRTNEMDYQIIQYYKDLIYTLPSLQQSLSI
jgi:TPR repeat protein